MCLLWFGKEKAALAKKILTREFLAHSPSHAVRAFYLSNCVVESASQSLKPAEKLLWTCLQPGEARGHKSFFFSFGCKRHHYHAEGFPLLSALFSSAPRCMSCARLLVMKLLSIFLTQLLVGVFPWYTSNKTDPSFFSIANKFHSVFVG